MSMITRNPLCDFRAVSTPTVGVKATATTTAPTAQSIPPNNNLVPYLVIQDITACSVSTAAQAPLIVNVIDGTTGGTNVVWSGVLGGAANQASTVSNAYLNIPCKSGFATIEFAAAGGTACQQSVSMGGYYGGQYGG